MILTAILFLLGSVYLCYTISMEENFFASPAQLSGTAAIVIALVVLAFTIRHAPGVRDAAFSPSLWLAGGFSLVLSSLFMLTESLPGWTKVAACLFLILVFFTGVFLWSQRSDWSALHRLASAGGGMLTYAWLGVVMEPESGPKSVFDSAGSVFLALGAVALFIIAIGKLQNFQQIVSQKHIR